MSPLSAGAKRALMELASKKAARKTPVKPSKAVKTAAQPRSFMAAAMKEQVPVIVEAMKKAMKLASLPPFDATPAMLKKLPPLGPCRFCKKKNTGSLRTGMPSMGFWVHCMNTGCFAAGPRRSTHYDAVVAWNK